ncbi:lymphocyte antigen 6G6e-like isoform X3 [Acinonyx jubatus]|uniref:Lymphocyte antigen 6G6e-like isoform X3 n=1 Tax=Acinonyx jubatus TaxID=32536 RepID=A0ABM3Q509_ACIJB|nr:lymphocyte antigen 6G6e-like isoform X3 [Acinonyx jubatus]
MRSSSICLCLLFLCGALGKGGAGGEKRGRLEKRVVRALEGRATGNGLRPGEGLTTSPTRGRLRCYTCSFSKPCYPVLTECQDDEVCGISIGTSEQSEIIERKGCLPRAQCPLQGHATYWSRSYALRHHCCEQNLCNTATMLQRLPSPLLITLLLLVASFMWGAHLLH